MRSEQREMLQFGQILPENCSLFQTSCARGVRGVGVLLRRQRMSCERKREQAAAVLSSRAPAALQGAAPDLRWGLVCSVDAASRSTLLKD